MQAIFQSQLHSPVIDESAGIIRGCRIATLGAVSQAAEGYGRGLVMNEQAVTGLFNLAKQNGDRVPAFFTHEWFDDVNRDPLNFDAGVWNNFRLDSGNLVADFQAFETPFKAGIFSRAKADPDSIAVSPIFDYDVDNSNITLCKPTAFISADFVKYGAINKALFKKTTTQNMPITIDDLKQLLNDPDAKEMIRSCIEGHDEAMNDENEAAEMEKEADVTDEDKQKDDEQRPALMRAFKRCNRALFRRSKSLVDTESLVAKMKGELRTIAKAAATEVIGNSGFVKKSDLGNNSNEAETYIAAQMGSGCPTRAHAIARMGKDKPELYREFRSY